MLIIKVEVIKGMKKARAWVDKNPETKVKVSHTRENCVLELSEAWALQEGL